MPVMLFNLRSVPEDEAEEIRALLSKNNIDYYETPAGRWGISVEAIWLKDESLLDTSKQLIQGYQQQRSQRIRQEFKELKQQGKLESFWQRIINRPVQTISYIAIILVIIYLVTMPFVKLALK